MAYTITVTSPFCNTFTYDRARRDGAEYLLRRMAYDELKSRALLDRPVARRVMAQCDKAWKADCDFVAVHIQETTLRFRKVA